MSDTPNPPDSPNGDDSSDPSLSVQPVALQDEMERSFLDMEIRDNRKKVVESFRNALARDKTRTQVFDISELGLVEMTRKRVGEGLLTNFADQCPDCEGRGVRIDHALLA